MFRYLLALLMALSLSVFSVGCAKDETKKDDKKPAAGAKKDDKKDNGKKDDKKKDNGNKDNGGTPE